MTISIAMATYNGAKYLPQLLDSLKAQTVQADEIIVVDDCSKDNTVQILREYESSLPLKIVQNETNLGVNKNFQKATNLCSGDFVLLCDQDDFWFPNNIEQKIFLLKKFPDDQPNLVTTSVILADKDLKAISNLSINRDVFDWRELAFRAFQGTTMAFNRKLISLLDSWPESFKSVPYDYYIYLVAILTGNVMASKEVLMYYRSHEKNVSFRSGRVKNALKSLFPFYKFFTHTLTLRKIELIEFALATPSVQKEAQMKEMNFYRKLVSCAKGNGISWFDFFKIRELTFLTKAKVFMSSVLYSFK